MALGTTSTVVLLSFFFLLEKREAQVAGVAGIPN